MTRPNPLLEAALGYAERGWPVFPCNPSNKTPLLAKDKDPATGKPIKGSGGVTKASTDPDTIRAWWRRWPNALIGLATGHPTLDASGLRLFALDFDPRADHATGEVWTLDRLKGETEAQCGCRLPPSLTALSPSDGVHLYLLQPDDGPPITNRGNLPLHVDVRGLGGYVIAPPSVMAEAAIKGQGGLRYRWHRKEPIGGIAHAPPELIAELRAPKRRAKATAPKNDVAADQAAAANPSSLGRSTTSTEQDALRRYAMNALDAECRTLAGTPLGNRNNQANASGFVIGQLVGAGALGKGVARAALADAVQGFNEPDKAEVAIDNGLEAGIAQPRDLSDVIEGARRRAPSRSPPRPTSAAPLRRQEGEQSSQTGGSASKDDQRGRGGEAEGGEGLTRRCAFHPLTDLGNLERLLDRYGHDFLHVEAWGWLAWDGRRWNRDMAEPMLGLAFQRTIRAIQEEAAFVRSSGVPFPDRGELDALLRADDEEAPERKAKIKAWQLQSTAAKRVPDHGGERLDSIVQVKSSGEIVLYSDKLAAWGRTSESSSHIGCLAQPKMAPSRLAARTEDFDSDPLKLNVLNGTIVFLRPEEGYDAAFSRREHRREDRMTKLADVEHDPRAACPEFDGFLARVQPEEEMRDFLDVWSGYNALGLSDAQKFALFYGEGSNGKGVWVISIAGLLGDYAWAAGIETFMDQGRYKKGGDASPDLAALAGRRMVYANEPEENSKFSDGLIKALTSDEPKGGVRELMKPPFELQITFTNTVMANTLPKIGTDHGIQRRVQVVPWDVIIPDEEQDLQLKAKIKAQRSGILNRMIAGALRYLQSGLPSAKAILEATAEYQQDNDLLGKFVELCIARVPGEVVGARPLWRVFAAWQTWAGLLPATGKPWSEKHLNTQMRKKKFKIGKSSTNKWQDIALRYEASDFCEIDLEEKILRANDDELPAPRRYPDEVSTGPPQASPPDPVEEDDDVGLPYR